MKNEQSEKTKQQNSANNNNVNLNRSFDETFEVTSSEDEDDEPRIVDLASGGLDTQSFQNDQLKSNDFKQNQIKIEFQNFVYPEYKQIGDNFVSNLSIIDLLFNEGSNLMKILLTSKIN